MLYLAQEYGWKMEGTRAPDGVDQAEWDGGYATNDGRVVSRRDASSFADALERAVVEPNRSQAAARLSKQILENIHSGPERFRRNRALVKRDSTSNGVVMGI